VKVRGLIKENALRYKSSRWMNSEGQTISTCSVYDKTQVEVLVENPMRKQTVTGLIKVVIYKDNALLPDERVKEESRILTSPPLSTGRISTGFSPEQESGYHYMIFIEGKQTYVQPKSFPPRLYASKSETALILVDPSNSGLTASTVTFSGKLIEADTGHGIDGAKIHIYDTRHMRRDNRMASGTTGSEGGFTIERIAKKMHWWNDTVQIYAKFEGDDVYKPSTSSPYTISMAQVPRDSDRTLFKELEVFSRLLSYKNKRIERHEPK